MSREPIAYLRDLDGTGSLHPCAPGDPGAIAVYDHPKPEQAVGDGVVELLQRGFITSQSYGPDKDYKLVIKFQSLSDLQAAHRAVTAPRPAPVEVGDGVVMPEMKTKNPFRFGTLEYERRSEWNAGWNSCRQAIRDAAKEGK